MDLKGMSRVPLNLRLTRTQEIALEAGEVTMTVDQSPIFPGCYICRDTATKVEGAGRTPRQAYDAMEVRAAR